MCKSCLVSLDQRSILPRFKDFILAKERKMVTKYIKALFSLWFIKKCIKFVFLTFYFISSIREYIRPYSVSVGYILQIKTFISIDQYA